MKRRLWSSIQRLEIQTDIRSSTCISWFFQTVHGRSWRKSQWFRSSTLTRSQQQECSDCVCVKNSSIAEKNTDKYNSMKLKLFNLKWSMTETFRDYILGSKFSVYTTIIHQSFINCLTWSNRNEIGESACAIRFYHQIHIRKSEQICGGIK